MVELVCFGVYPGLVGAGLVLRACGVVFGGACVVVLCGCLCTVFVSSDGLSAVCCFSGPLSPGWWGGGCVFGGWSPILACVLTGLCTGLCFLLLGPFTGLFAGLFSLWCCCLAFLFVKLMPGPLVLAFFMLWCCCWAKGAVHRPLYRPFFVVVLSFGISFRGVDAGAFGICLFGKSGHPPPSPTPPRPPPVFRKNEVYNVFP